MSDATFTTLSVLVPVYNEQRTLHTIAEKILKAQVPLELDVVMVDDGSSDDSWEIMQGLAADDDRIQVFRHDRNRGKGAAIRTAISHCRGDVAIVQDADLEYDPAEFGRVIGPILEGRADAVFGSRFASSPERRVLFYWHSLGNKFLTWLFNVFNDLNLTDMETCYKAVRVDVLRQLRLESERFGIEPEISTRLAQWGARIYEVPISYHGRTYEEGKHIGWRDGLQALWLILKFRFIDTEYSATGEGSEVSLGIARGYARWVLDELSPDLDGDVVEIGAGVGNYSRLLLGARALTLTERSPRLAEGLRRRFSRSPHVSVEERGIELGLDAESYDTLVSFNALAAADDPAEWIRQAGTLLRRGGSMHLLVPGHEDLTTAIDRSMKHRRRFEPTELAAMLADVGGLDQIRIREFNRLGAVLWRLSGAAGFSRVGTWQARVFGVLVPLARRIDAFGFGRGVSLIISARKPA